MQLTRNETRQVAAILSRSELRVDADGLAKPFVLHQVEPELARSPCRPFRFLIAKIQLSQNLLGIVVLMACQQAEGFLVEHLLEKVLGRAES